jgi:hypothetical protein
MKEQPMTTATSWTVTIEEADDGSGDLVMPLPEDMLAGVGWVEGDTLEWIYNNDGTWSLKKVEQ